ncbi:hypothetical protein LJC31_04480 [Synergistaceae bacterium OttesenSCG-928-I11]|nr:hypothetical protein [Synergistaceae bacterium OttesenSCG-928-I11]
MKKLLFKVPKLSLLLLITIFMLCSPCLAESNETQPGDIDMVGLDIKAERIRSAIKSIDVSIQGEHSKIMKELDEWSQSELKKILDAHYVDVEQAIQHASLPSDTSRFSVYWAQLKAGLTFDSDLQKMLELFFKDVDDKIKRPVQVVEENIAKSFAQISTHAVGDAQKRISEPFTDELKLLGLSVIPQPQLDDDISKIENAIRTDSDYTKYPVFAGSGLIILLLTRKILAKIATHLTLKISGKVLAKCIPIIGIVLMGIEVWDAATAKTALEKNLREAFMEEYKNSFTVDEIWKGTAGLRDSFEKGLDSNLEIWVNACRKNADRYLNARRAWASPKGLEFIKDSEKKGIMPQVAADEFALMQNTFGPLAEIEPIEKLRDIYYTAPNKDELARLAKGLDSQFMILYKEHGRTLLEVVNAFGASNFVANHDRLSHDKISKLSKIADSYQNMRENQDAFSGLLVLLDNDVTLENVKFNNDELVTVFRNPQILDIIIKSTNKKPEVIAQIFSSEKALNNIDVAMKKSHNTAMILLKHAEIYFWSTHDKEDINLIFTIIEFLKQKGENAEPFLAELLDDSSPMLQIYENHGASGLDLWYSHTRDGASKNAESNVESSIRLYQKGYPLDDLKNVEKLRWAEKCDWVPIVGLTFYKLTASMSVFMKLLMFLIAIFVILIVAASFYKRLRKIITPHPVSTGSHTIDVTGEVQAITEKESDLPKDNENNEQKSLDE